MINYFYWLEKPWEIRLKLAESFGLKRAGGTVVENDRVTSDGYTQDAVYQAFSIERMQEFLGSKETNPVVLFDLCVEKIMNKSEINENGKNENAEFSHSGTETNERGGDEHKVSRSKKKAIARKSK